MSTLPSAGDVVKYGFNESIRTDIVLRDNNDVIVGVWDLKTGNAQLTDARRQEIRDELRISRDVPIMELHFSRGVVKKIGVRLNYSEWQI